MKTSDEKMLFWKNHTEALAVSGLTQRAYAKNNNIPYHQLKYWRQRLLIDNTSKKSFTKAEFKPIHIAPKILPSHNLQITLRNGNSLSFSASVAIDTVGAIVSMIGDK